ncbi:hypothetical protein GGR42_000451 [Saonia flava]|uniref:Uncharacterized protein n=1 Tax=Saonia flava TaxID=523696 RepID=A0A846QZG7_9FLAO|nr:hypothetical protein [Saonia flava]NJB69989.1 hypothetical protein [Saonia flava]
MSNDYRDPKFKKWLDKLQQESWQLELIISGFAIYGLMMVFEPIMLNIKEAGISNKEMASFIWIFTLSSCSILIFNLILHVILRGLWIGALGLRYVSGDIDYDKLNYTPKFTNYLKRKIGSFDKYIANLENYCSVLFAISFLLIFYVLAIFIVLALIALIGESIFNNDNISGNFKMILGISLAVLLLIGVLFTFIDFLTHGFLKKKKWLAKIYFPIYWVFSFITLSFLYRPLVHNFLDNRFGKRLSYVLIPLYTVILLLTSLNLIKSNYLSLNKDSSSIFANKNNYENLLRDEGDFVEYASIPSKVITDSYLKVFLKFTDNTENDVFDFNPGIKPEKDKRGYDFDIRFGASDEFLNPKKYDSIRKEYLKTFNDIHSVFIDSIKFKSDFVITSNHKDQLGFETYLKLDSIKDGKHLLAIKRLKKRKTDTTETTLITIPFWSFKD